MRSPIGRNELRQISAQLSQRDRNILWFIRRHQYANTIQIRRQFFFGHASIPAAARACARVLNRLYGQRILTRLERRVGGVKHGSSSYVWCIDVVGDRLTRRPSDPRWRPHEPSIMFLDHTLAITEAHVQLQEATAAGHLQVTKVEVETEAWKQFVTPSGAKSILKPDLKITISGEGYDDHWYLEIDRGTESLPTLIRKCHAYEQYRRTGRAQSEYGVFPRVLWVLPDTRRVERLRAAINKDAELPNAMFTCITNDSLISTLRNPP
ncbi:MAG: replication-relaxation family protein [Thermomicrobiales bacterium]|nr:replication-relaxation family protein [Thermomicrobiales bacterium]MCO5219169.1 replication-relaxation family protein [Thermomicrobiales bacterium]MCO5225857.1 replication-relaxation family protein [Thermomicrobiales bacterium]MCO5228073.1 replication-relaxation family protein [Thermomicrobiales bacterium]